MINDVDCTDDKLIRWFQGNYDKIEFINIKLKYTRKDRKGKIIENVKKLSVGSPLHKQREILKDLWKYLVGSAIIYLKLKDSREVYHDDGDYGFDELEKYFDEFCEFEKNLYGSSEYYRDHLSHLFKVFLLGGYLLSDGQIGFDKLIVGDKKLPTGKKISVEEKEAMWCLSALTHDLGYPLEKIYKISESSRNMVRSFDMETISFNISQKGETFNEFIIKFISSVLVATPENKDFFFVHVQPKFLWKLTRAWEQFDHGVSTALLIFKKLVYFLESDYCLDELKPMNSDDAKQFLIRNQILKAVAVHHCNYVYHLSLFDFSFFLRIIDEMQEWRRPRLKDLFESFPDCEVIINKIDVADPKRLEFTMQFAFKGSRLTLNDEEAFQIKKTILEIFLSKAEKFIEILRSAVDGAKRDFVINFKVKDCTKSPKLKEEIEYYFNHEKPDDITFKLNNNKTYLEVLRDIKDKRTVDEFINSIKTI
jgi:hypothetical protein